ncbi:MAG: prolipoprotein diacylglyceryl transferase [Deltaproteobacteria bacterium]|jgi:phosphatidylglycerol:prolipoprotein diacylglycerol transferase|nr:prolipoprotein diacylglyceryl transferase [Deltaproteobacteria bacterium]
MAFPWYGTMYAVAFSAIWFLARRDPLTVGPGRRLNSAQLDTIIVWAMVGAVLGGRLGYAFLYEPGHYLKNPADIFRLWQGGMSFHGGLLGTLAAVRLAGGGSGAFWPVLDRLVRWVPLGLGLGRAGNFLTGELWGRPSEVPWAMFFDAAGPVPRHPSQLYEAFLEGPFLWFLVGLYARRLPAPGRTSAFMAIVYALVRIAAEFFREPDPGWGYLAWGWLTWGQILSLALLGVGLAFFFSKSDRPPSFKSVSQRPE